MAYPKMPAFIMFYHVRVVSLGEIAEFVVDTTGIKPASIHIIKNGKAILRFHSQQETDSCMEGLQYKEMPNAEEHITVSKRNTKFFDDCDWLETTRWIEVNGLTLNTSRKEIKQHIKQLANVKVQRKNIYLHCFHTRGYHYMNAHVLCDSHSNALTAVRKLCLSELNGHKLWVQIRKSEMGNGTILKLSNLSEEMGKPELLNLLIKRGVEARGIERGNITEFQYTNPTPKHQQEGYAYVQFSTPANATKMAEALNGVKIGNGGHELSIRFTESLKCRRCGQKGHNASRCKQPRDDIADKKLKQIAIKKEQLKELGKRATFRVTHLKFGARAKKKMYGGKLYKRKRRGSLKEAKLKEIIRNAKYR